MPPLMRRMATSLILNTACTAAPCFAHPPAARADSPPRRQAETTQELIRQHYALTGQPGLALAPVAFTPAPIAFPGSTGRNDTIARQ